MGENNLNLALIMSSRMHFRRELDEIFPENYLHHTLQNLFILMKHHLKTFISSGLISVYELLGDGRQELCYELEATVFSIICCETFEWDETETLNPHLPFWYLRRFLINIPTPLFNNKDDDQRWLHFINKNYQEIETAIKNKLTRKKLYYAIALKISRLPNRNILIIHELFRMFKFMCLEFNTGSYSYDNAYCIMRYYAPCLFKRPCDVQVIEKNDKKWIVLAMYIALFWFKIRGKIRRIIFNVAEEPRRRIKMKTKATSTSTDVPYKCKEKANESTIRTTVYMLNVKNHAHKIRRRTALVRTARKMKFIIISEPQSKDVN